MTGRKSLVEKRAMDVSMQIRNNELIEELEDGSFLPDQEIENGEKVRVVLSDDDVDELEKVAQDGAVNCRGLQVN